MAPTVMSLLCVSGSGQGAAVAVLASGGAPAAAVASAALVNARFVPMGLAVAGSLRGGRARRATEGQAVVDAGFLLAARGDESFDRSLLLGFFLVMLPAWTLGTAAGAALGPPPWGTIVAVAIAGAVLKGVGPALLGDRPLGPRGLRVVAALGPALLAALVVSEVAVLDRRLVADARLGGTARARLSGSGLSGSRPSARVGMNPMSHDLRRDAGPDPPRPPRRHRHPLRVLLCRGDVSDSARVSLG